MNKYIVFAIFISAALCMTQAMSCENKWQIFVKKPSQKSYNNLRDKQFHKCENKGQYVNNDTEDRLIELINKKNKYAIDAGFLLIPKLDGGNLEDMYTAVGNAITNEPVFVLEMFNKHKIPLYGVYSILSMVSYNIIEDDMGMAKLIDERAAAINSVNQKHLQGLKKESIRILRHESEQLHKIINGEKKSGLSIPDSAR